MRTLTATLEQDAATHKRESQQFDSLSVSPPVAQPVGGLARSGAYAARLNAGGSTPQPLGPLTQLGVQRGDTVTVQAFGYYQQPVQHGFLFSLASFVANLFHPASPPPPGLEAPKRLGFPLLQVGVAAGLSSIPQLGNGVPKGYLRVVVFTKDSVLAPNQPTPVQLSQAANGQYEPLQLQLVLPQDGYVTAYVGNESDVDVLFDDVSVEYRPGLQVQENQYEPWGLSLVGLDYATPKTVLLNNYKFNGNECQNDLGAYFIDFNARFYNPQIGRMNSVDKFSELTFAASTFAYAINNPISFKDPTGNFVVALHAELTADALRKNGYSEKVVSLLAHYASVYADHASVGLTILNGMSYWHGIDYSETANSQNTGSALESKRHSMQADGESIGYAAATRRGQEFGWKKIFEAASQGDLSTFTENSKGAKAFGVGIHALQDSKAHEGVKMSEHDIFKDLGMNKEENNALNITNSAVKVVQMLNGNFSNVKDGETLDISGMGSKELDKLTRSILNSNVSNITLSNRFSFPGEQETGSGFMLNRIAH